MLSIDLTFVIVFVLVWFLVLFLSRIFFKPVSRIKEKRESLVRENREAAGRALESYEQALRTIEGDLKDARLDAARIREAFESEALKEKARLLAELHGESRKEIEKARKEIDAQIDRLKAELSAEVERLAEKVEKKVLP